MVELDTAKKMVTIPPVPFRWLHKIECVIVDDFFSHECHAALEQSSKDA